MAIQKPFVVIPHKLGTIVVAPAKANRPVSHAGEFANPGMVWETNSTFGFGVTGDFGGPRDIDFIALVGTNAQVGTGYSLRLGTTQAEAEGAAPYSSGSQLIRNPAILRDDGFYVSHLELPSMQTYRWWRLDINSHTGDFRCAAIVMGFKRQFADFYNGGDGIGFGLDDMADISLGEYGVVQETDGIMLRTLSMQFGWMTDSDRINKFTPVLKTLGKRGVALWCFDPDPTIQRQEKTYFGWLKELPVFKPSTYKQDRWAAPFEIISMI